MRDRLGQAAKAIARLELQTGHRFKRAERGGDEYKCRRCHTWFAGPVLRTAIALSECGAKKATAT